MKPATRYIIFLIVACLCSCSTSSFHRETADVAAEVIAPLPGARNCMTTHLDEAIIINTARLPRYAALSNDASKAVSTLLIDSETFALTLAEGVDRQAYRYHQVGIGIVCDEFVSMKTVRGFSEELKPWPIASYKSIDGRKLTKSLNAAFKQSDFGALSVVASAAIETLTNPRANCMVRHVLESIVRIANLAPVHNLRAKELGIESTLPLSDFMVKLHLVTLAGSATLDDAAAPIQAVGLGIICSDVPAIPPHL